MLNRKLFDMMSKEMKKEKKHLEKELIFFLSYYKEVTCRSEQMKAYYDEQIEAITNRLKELGHY